MKQAGPEPPLFCRSGETHGGTAWPPDGDKVEYVIDTGNIAYGSSKSPSERVKVFKDFYHH